MIGKPGGFSFARGGFLPEREPDMSKMPALKPMASHTVTRPTKRAPIQRSLASGGR